MLNYLFPFSFMCFGVFGLLHSKSDRNEDLQPNENVRTMESLVNVLSSISSFMLVILSSIWLMLYFTG